MGGPLFQDAAVLNGVRTWAGVRWNHHADPGGQNRDSEWVRTHSNQDSAHGVGGATLESSSLALIREG